MNIDKKNKLLLLGIVLLLFASYKLAINKTLLLKTEHKRLSSQVELFTNIPKQLSILTQKEKYYDSILGKMDMGDTSVQNNLLRTINQEAKTNTVNVMDFNQPHIYRMGESDLQTFSFRLSGNFTDILKVIHTIEQKGNFGEVVHVDFIKKKDYRSNTENLAATVFVQHVK